MVVFVFVAVVVVVAAAPHCSSLDQHFSLSSLETKKRRWFSHLLSIVLFLVQRLKACGNLLS